MPNPKTVGRNYIDFSSKRIINNINMNNYLFSKISINNKTEGKKLPSIDKKRSYSFNNQQFQSLEKIRRKNQKKR